MNGSTRDLAYLREEIAAGASMCALVGPDQELRHLALQVATGCWVAGWLEAHA
jgi:hypothetical protein